MVHSSLYGLMSVPSIGGYIYYIIFVDDFSRKTWIYFLENNESIDVLNKFKEFKSLIENLTSKMIKILRMDNGGEYIFEAFSTFCIESGIEGVHYSLQPSTKWNS